jgi:hypothetical protein
MAGRHLQRLLKEDLAAAADAAPAEESSDEEADAAPRPAFNPFDLLTDDEDEVRPAPAPAAKLLPADPADAAGLTARRRSPLRPQAQQGGASDEEAHSGSDAPGPAPAPPPSPPPEAAQPSKKSRARARRAAAAAAGGAKPAAPRPAPRAAPAAAKDAGEEDIDAILAELNMSPAGAAAAAPPDDGLPSAAAAAAAASSSSAAAAPSAPRPLLAVDFRHLRPEEELRRMFGSRVVEAAAAADDDAAGGGAAAYAGASRRVRRLAARGLLRRADAGLRPGLMIAPREAWPRLDGGAALERRDAAAAAAPDGGGGGAAFCYWHYALSPQYHAVQELYEECQATMDPNAIAALLQRHPWHLDALLTMADFYRAMGENAAADEMLERW